MYWMSLTVFMMEKKTLRIIENTKFYKRLSLFDVHSESDKNQHLNLLIYTERQDKWNWRYEHIKELLFCNVLLLQFHFPPTISDECKEKERVWRVNSKLHGSSVSSSHHMGGGWPLKERGLGKFKFVQNIFSLFWRLFVQYLQWTYSTHHPHILRV